MRHKGNGGYYQDERDRELLHRFHEHYDSRGSLSLKEYVRKIINMPAPSFFVTEDRTFIAINDLRTGKVFGKIKQEMYSVINNRVSVLMSSDPAMTLRQAICKVIYSTAPKLYITPSSALTALYLSKKRWKNKKILDIR